MPALFPPDYPERPDAPLLSFGPSFSEEIARSVAQAVCYESRERPHEAEVRVAAALTMLEAFHPRDHLECMLAAQAVAVHSALMECLRRAMHAETEEGMAIKLRGNVAQLSRTFSVQLHDLERRQSKPLPARPDPPPPSNPPADPGLEGPPDEAERPDDIETRPDGSPGSLLGYISEPGEESPEAGEPAIMVALATRRKSWRMVNGPADAAHVAAVEPAEPGSDGTSRGPLDLTEPMFTGDAIARFAAARYDPGTPTPSGGADAEQSIVELEIISTGGDPEAEAERLAMIAAHPEGKAVKTIRHGFGKRPPEKPGGK
jgi:hypothetical protein